jgi:hypothetical protein
MWMHFLNISSATTTSTTNNSLYSVDTDQAARKETAFPWRKTWLCALWCRNGNQSEAESASKTENEKSSATSNDHS